jgi:hypothetical protein
MRKSKRSIISIFSKKDEENNSTFSIVEIEGKENFLNLKQSNGGKNTSVEMLVLNEEVFERISSIPTA